ncbi:hypothetical protein M8J76_004988 [Diaphorina citri]|nr:hypothetical protein M8J76_004988 [Diaphorina citri]
MIMEVEKSRELPPEAKEKQDLVKQVRTLLSTISSAAKDANTSLDNINKQELSVSKGISILDVKYQNKLMYLTNISYLMMKRLHGKQIHGDEAIDRLVTLRTVLERIRPLEQKLKYQIDKYIKIATRGDTNPNDPTSFKANPDMLMMNEEPSDDDEEETGKKKKKDKGEVEVVVYKPPKLSSVHYDGDVSRNEKQAKSLERARKRALSSNLMQELKEEYLDRPMEYSHSSSNTLKNIMSEREQARQDYEETYFTRLPLEKKSKKSKFNQLTLNSIGDQVTRFEDLSALHGGGGEDDEDEPSKKRKRMLGGKNKKRTGGGGGGGKGKKKRKFK